MASGTTPSSSPKGRSGARASASPEAKLAEAEKLLESDRQEDAARALSELVVDGDREVAPRAALRLGRLHEENDELALAEQAYLWIVESSRGVEPGLQATAALNLGHVRERRLRLD